SWRVKRVRRFVDHVISALPFERDWYEQHGVEVHYVGHPFFDEVQEYPLDARFVDRWSQYRPGKTIAILPGSRSHEIHRNWPVMLQVMQRLHARHPDVNFLVACYREKYRRFCLEEMLQTAAELPVQFFVDRTSEIIEAADCALMVSGSVSLEMVARNTPAVVLYRTSWPTYFIGRALVHCRFMSLANLIGQREIMPEFLSVGDPEPQIQSITDRLDRWMGVPEERQRVVAELRLALGDFIETGATVRASEFILHQLTDEGVASATDLSDSLPQTRVA
ncbi:MAG: lipid-A-disaccharide synthase, partial [Planctomycetaceae bacterium]